MHRIAFSSMFNKFVTATAILALVLAALPVMPVFAASITVNTTTDEYLDNTSCSLREAIIAANMNTSFFGCTYTGTGPDDIITLESGAAYILTRPGTTTTTGDLDIGNADGTSGNLTIQASGTSNAIIDADGINNRVMEVDDLGDTNLTLIHITLTGGNSPDGSGLYFAGNGTLTLNNSTVSGNTATSESNCGAGVFNSSLATVIINNTTIENNTCTAAGADGAGLLKATGGTLTITNSTFANNTTPDNGGGVRVDIESGTATITNSTFANNSAGARGGGLQVKSGTVTVSFSTFSGNSASYPGPSTGGAVQATGGSISVLQSILANSTGSDCDQLLPGTVSVTNSLVENNSDCTGTIVSSADPSLGALADNGGSTQTMALSPGAPAINLSNDINCPATDQRGVTRPQGAHCDLGAYEFEDAPPVVSSINRASTNPTSASSVNFTVTFSEDVTGVDVSDFILTTTGVTGAAITGVSGSGTTYTVTVDTGTGDGTIRLDLVDDDSIHDTGGNALGGTGAGNANFSSGEVYTVKKSADVDVVIGGNTEGNYTLNPAQSTLDSYDVDSGPVKVTSTNELPILTSERFIFSYQNSKSYAEMMGYPDDQLTTEYWFTWYNNLSYSTQLRVSNMGSNSAEVKVYTGSSTTPIDTFTLLAGEGKRVSYNIDNGPLHVVSTDGVTPILASERFIQTFKNSASYAELMGYPGDQLATEYWFPWYNNISYSTQLRISNLGGSSAEVKVYAGSSTTAIDTLTIPAGEGIRKSYTGLDNGPLHIVSTDGVTPILASERFIQTFGDSASYAEMMGYPGNQLTSEYCFPWYNNTMDSGVTLSSQLRVSNMGTTNVTVKVTLAGSDIDSFTLAGGEGKRTSYTTTNNGPLCVTRTSGTASILASERFISTYGSSASYSEMMGYPTNHLDSTYWFPWYNNLSYSTEMRIAKP